MKIEFSTLHKKVSEWIKYPTPHKNISKWIVTPLIYIWTLLYVQDAIQLPATEIYTVGMSAFGITAGLSGVCFAMASVPRVTTSASEYAGEKFLHSAILLIQTLLTVSIRDALMHLQFIQDYSILTLSVKGIFAAILTFVAITAVQAWHFGFSELNGDLWKRWEHRVRELNKQVQQTSGCNMTTEKSIKNNSDKDVTPLDKAKPK